MHNHIRNLRITDDKHGLGPTLPDQLIYALHDRPAPPRTRVPNHRLRIRPPNRPHDVLAVILQRVPRTPIDSGGRDIRMHEAETRADARPRRHEDDALEQPRRVEQAVQGISPDPELALALRGDLLGGPVAGVAHDDAEADGFALGVDVRDGGEGVPFQQGLVGELHAVERGHAGEPEVQAGSVVGQFLGIDFAQAQTGPGEQGAGGGDEDGPEGGRLREGEARGDSRLARGDGRGEDVVQPEGEQGGPAGEAVEGFE